jgi:hypothetical protein
MDGSGRARGAAFEVALPPRRAAQSPQQAAAHQRNFGEGLMQLRRPPRVGIRSWRPALSTTTFVLLSSTFSATIHDTSIDRIQHFHHKLISQTTSIHQNDWRQVRRQGQRCQIQRSEVCLHRLCVLSSWSGACHALFRSKTTRLLRPFPPVAY